MKEAVEASAAPPRRAPRWSFGRALLALLVLMSWFEAIAALVRGTRSPADGARLLRVSGLFLALLPFFALLVYRWRWVHGFFRSIEVGVMNLVLIGLGAIVGVLVQQEDPFQPTPRGAIERLAEQAGRAADTPWTREENLAYQDYLSFRNAHAFFAYHLLGRLGLRGTMGFDGPSPGESAEDQGALANLATRLPDLRARFGEEFAVAIESQSETGLRTRARNAEIRALEERWDDLWWTIFVWTDRLDFRRAYRSDWYALLWAVLFGGVLSNTFRGGARRLLHPRMWGFALTHAGVLAVIGGGFWGRVSEERGILELRVGESGGTYQRYAGGRGILRDRSLFGSGAPFEVRLEEFRADAHDVLDVVFAKRGEDGAPYPEYELAQQPKLRLFDGKTAAYDWTGAGGAPRLRLEVLDYFPQAEMRLELRAARAEELGFPVARLRFEDFGGAEPETGLLLPSRPGEDFVRSHDRSGTRLRLDSAADQAEAAAMLRTPPAPRYGSISLPPGDAHGSAQTLDAVRGAAAEFRLGAESFRVEVLDATPDFQLRQGAGAALEAAPLEGPEERATARNPAVQVRIVAADGREERRWILQQDFSREDLLFPQLDLKFRWDAWAAPAARRLLFVALEDGRVLCGEVGDPASLREVGPDFVLPLDDAARLVVPEAFARGEVDVRYEPALGADFYDATPPAIRLRVVTPGGERELWMSAAEQRFEFLSYPGPDGAAREVALRFREDHDQGELPIEWRSRLSVWSSDAEGQARQIGGGEVRVNDYFVHGGYRFFQTNHNPADPSYSGIGVVYDPGIELVLFGLFAVMFGTAAVFLVKPLLTKRHRGVDA